MLNPVPAFTHSLTALSKILDKAEAHADAKKIKPEVIPQLRLVADMLPFTRQITIACDHAKGASARLAGVEVPSMADTETTVAELKERIAKTIAFIATIPAEAYADADGRTITIKSGTREMSFPAAQYYLSYALPNFFFHMTTAYAILRSNGVDIGKGDFVGA
ncbi:MAG: DUF1993 domain-containing protein [Paracoccaceae bacterium]